MEQNRSNRTASYSARWPWGIVEKKIRRIWCCHCSGSKPQCGWQGTSSSMTVGEGQSLCEYLLCARVSLIFFSKCFPPDLTPWTTFAYLLHNVFHPCAKEISLQNLSQHWRNSKWKEHCILPDLLFCGNRISAGLKSPILHFFQVSPPT